MSPENTKKPIPPTKEPIVTGKIGRRINRRQIILILLGLVVLVGGIFAYRAGNQPKQPAELSPADELEQTLNTGGVEEDSVEAFTYRVAVEYYSENNFQRVIDVLNNLDPSVDDPSSQPVYELYALAYEGLGDTENSQMYYALSADELQKSLDAMNKEVRWGAVMAVARANEGAGRIEQAKKYYQEFLDTVPSGEKKDETIQHEIDYAKAALERLN